MGLSLYAGHPDAYATYHDNPEEDGWDSIACDDGGPSVDISYGGFNVFRTHVAAAEMIEWELMAGIHEAAMWNLRYPTRRDPEPVGWSQVTSPVKPLLNHSDCEGYLTPEQAAQVYPRLREIATGWQNAWADGVRQRSYATYGLRVADLLQHAAEHGCGVIFA